MSRRERLCWIVAALWIGATYSTLSIARSVTDYLRDQHELTPFLVLLALVLATALGRDLWRSRPGPREWALLLGVGVVYLAFLPVLTGPEEALHFVQYGFLAGVFLTALRERRQAGGALPVLGTRWRPSPWAVVLTIAVGWTDEGIQDLLPNRFYDLRDVGFNAAAGLLVVVAMAGRQWARGRDEAARLEG